MSRRVIAHLDCDSFFAACHQIEDPSLEGKALIVAGSGPRSIVTTASYPARAYGVHSAMPASQARRLCPHALFIPPDRALYLRVGEQVWTRVRELLRAGGCLEEDEYDEQGERLVRMEQASIDEAYLDLTLHPGSPLPALRALVVRVREEVGITLSIGVGPNKLVAKIASDLEKPAGFTVLSREAALQRVGARSARLIPGVGPVTAEQLTRLGAGTVSLLAERELEWLIKHFGRSRGEFLYQAARMRSESPVLSVRERKSLSSEITFDEDLEDHWELRERVEALAQGLSEQARARGWKGRCLSLKVRTADWQTYTRSLTREQATDEATQLTEMAVRLWEENPPGAPVRLLGVRLSSLAHLEEELESPQLALFNLPDG